MKNNFIIFYFSTYLFFSIVFSFKAFSQEIDLFECPSNEFNTLNEENTTYFCTKCSEDTKLTSGTEWIDWIKNTISTASDTDDYYGAEVNTESIDNFYSEGDTALR